MKYLYIPFLLVVLASSCKPKQLPTVMKVTKDAVLLKCSHMTSKAELQKFKAILSQMHGVKMDDSATSYTETGTLKTFQSSLTKEGNTLATINADLMSLQYKYYGYELTFQDGEITHIKAGSF